MRTFRDIVSAVVYCYITTKFHYAKRDTELLAFGGVMLQRFEFTKVCVGNFNIFCNKNGIPQCLVVLSIVILLFRSFSAIRNLLSELSLFEFPLRKIKTKN